MPGGMEVVQKYAAATEADMAEGVGLGKGEGSCLVPCTEDPVEYD